MADYFFDISALVKRHVTDWFQQIATSTRLLRPKG